MNKYLEKVAAKRRDKSSVLPAAASGAAIGGVLSTRVQGMEHKRRVSQMAKGPGGESLAKVLGKTFKPNYFNRRTAKAAGIGAAVYGGLAALNAGTEKSASLHQYGRMAREAANIAVRNPLTTAFGAGGAMDGYLSTRREGREGKARVALRAARNTIVGAGKGAAAGKALELGYQHLKIKSASYEENKYLCKAAYLHKAVKTWRDLPTSSKLSLGVSATGLGISSANYSTNKSREQRAAEQHELDQKALAALRGIHRELKKQAADEDAEGAKRIGGAGAAYLGSKTIGEQYRRGHLTGRETLYHGSSTDNIKSIREHGLQPNRSDKGVTQFVKNLGAKNKNLVFAEKRKLMAHTYGVQQQAIASGRIKSNEELKAYQRTKQIPDAVKNSLVGRGKNVAEINLPTWKKEYKGVTNPEVKHQLRAMKGDFLWNVLTPNSQKEKFKKTVFKNFQSNVHVNRGAGGIGTEYIKGSKNYQRNSAKEIGEYIAHNKSRFAKGVGKSLAGAGLMAAGGYLLHNSQKSNA